MIVDIKKLREAIGRALWRNGHVRPEDLKHTVSTDGSHAFTLNVKAEDAVWNEPRGNPNGNYPSVGATPRSDGKGR